MDIIRIIAVVIISTICFIAQYNTLRIIITQVRIDKYIWLYMMCYTILELLFWIVSYTLIINCNKIWLMIISVILIIFCGSRNGDPSPKTNFMRMLFEEIFILIFIKGIIYKMPQMLRNISSILFCLIVAGNVIMIIYAIMTSGSKEKKRPDE